MQYGKKISKNVDVFVRGKLFGERNLYGVANVGHFGGVSEMLASVKFPGICRLDSEAIEANEFVMFEHKNSMVNTLSSAPHQMARWMMMCNSEYSSTCECKRSMRVFN